MIEIHADFWEVARQLPENSAICVTTNGCVKNNGELVMGRGIAEAFAKEWPHLPREMGRLFGRYGLHTRAVDSSTGFSFRNGFVERECTIVMLPTKLGMTKMTEDFQHLVPKGKRFSNGSWVQGWMLHSPFDLVRRSCEELLALTNEKGWEKVLLTRPGCGLGGLDWVRQVKPMLEEIGLDDRFIVVHNGK